MHFEFVNGHVLALSFGLACLMVGGGAYLIMRAIKDYRELFGSRARCLTTQLRGTLKARPATVRSDLE
jgi:hypothetical protein